MSSQAYQGGGRKLDRHLLETLKESVLGTFEPDLTIYLDLDPVISFRKSHRGRGEFRPHRTAKP